MISGVNYYASMNVYSCCSPLLSEQSIITGPTYLKKRLVAMTVGSQQAAIRFPGFEAKAAGFSTCTLLDKALHD
ncbi:Os06g0144850 [Oryza sativa Japonica Group]|uniref:Os06g0144850 protein n=1 Tax=Oryza sativa subsp. japonica TaxID=39947 RepID=A0A0P0WS93_ORYSJ|nr:hypothetical protein EE612_031892 [Oryza sativa]BAS96127.1 Os06g0144850 [Oryza sativa Japonica Group]